MKSSDSGRGIIANDCERGIHEGIPALIGVVLPLGGNFHSGPETHRDDTSIIIPMVEASSSNKSSCDFILKSSIDAMSLPWAEHTAIEKQLSLGWLSVA